MNRISSLAGRLFVGFVLTISMVGQEDAAQKVSSSAEQRLAAFRAGREWRAFLEQAPGEWIIDWCKATATPRGIMGTGIPLADWRGNSIEEARRQANLLLQQHATLLGLGTSEFRESIGARMGRTWSFTFEQYFKGLPVIGGRADVRVHMVGRVPYLGSTAWQIPADFSIVPALTGEVATAIAWQTLGEVPTGVRQPAAVAPPRLVVWGDVTADRPQTPDLAWEVALSNVAADGSGPIGRYFVDAASGAVLQWVSDKHECGIPGCTRSHAAPAAESSTPLPTATTVTVMGWTNVGLDAFDPLVNVPLPGVVLNVPGIGDMTTDANGQFVININAPVSITVGALDGRHFAPIVGSNAPGGNFTVNPGVNTTIQLLTSGASSAESAHTNTAWWVDRANQWARSILGNSSQMNTADDVVPTVNINLSCNAYYLFNTINFYVAAGGCTNTANNTLIVHEWGHGIDDRYGGVSNNYYEGLSEGWADIFAMYLVDSPNLFSGLVTAGVPVRSGNNTRQYHTAMEVHDAGESWMGFAWQLRDRLAATLGSRPQAIALTETIVIGSIVANATDQPGAVIQVLLADDNDGNIANGTPHTADILWACQQHSLPYPDMALVLNDECSGAFQLFNGVNGPFTTSGAFSSSPPWPGNAAGGDAWFRYVAAGNGTLTVSTCGLASWDTALEILTGSCGTLTSLAFANDTCGQQETISVPVTMGQAYYVRIGGHVDLIGEYHAGAYSLNVTGPPDGLARSLPFGTGCGGTPATFYQRFNGLTFDLANTSMRFTGQDVVAGGSYVTPPPTATVLALGNNTETTVNLLSPFPCAGGMTNSLVVCDNGFVSAAAGNGTSGSPSTLVWLLSPQPRWGCWKDFEPTSAGSGQIKFHEAGSVSYVTWDGVMSHYATGPSTFQLQFDRATGDVTFVFGAMSFGTTPPFLGGAAIVGYAGAGPNSEPPVCDLSVAVPFGMHVGVVPGSVMTLASTPPTLGATLTLTTSAFPATSPLGVQVLGYAVIPGGVDLTFLGMTGCHLYTSLDALYPMFPVGGACTYSLPVPNNQALVGAALTAQTAAFVSGANPAGLVSSNGLQVMIGL